ncbi:hypothetical protein AX14_001982 [Amanita brunnescens Koide BX004]|nr:hypothetical protein AX14_001982 [Amanita brunnescens Koide BX004]
MARFALLSLIPFLLVLCVAASPAVPQFLIPAILKEKWSYDDCSVSSGPIQLQSLEVSPDPPKAGQSLTVKAKANVQDVIEEGAYADVTVKLGLIKLLHKRFDLCEEARNSNASVTCPVQPGPYEVEQTVQLPKEIPRAKFHVDVQGYTVDDEELLCLKLMVDFFPL